jgi:hypothetical protein
MTLKAASRDGDTVMPEILAILATEGILATALL